ncbi:hypothetical protein LOY37_12285 [Pseudomonas sp. B21-012]|uniref:hypothetical protein n=1 Tax=unclassified Pseudomonas TaxID=196821 RepID=UPI0005EADDB8|nr:MULTISPECIES: hypothetical protein [unclassified Pseudomonas]KJK16697.1 hypothetical protein UB48_15915 [Pseudomonas sp. 2(2015)]UVL58684.1 hypothetical protein LOY22_12175 [Pseudomonas sp. B21-035]UVL64014.1 hypothetical protein LOY54_12325 [Pseudomonas sp. B21-032]UVM58320.1 hypothetical protein LOY37_12285 [Pseudomonas sp. B21-012]SDQ73615.1 hypothetical protein SAMN05216487_3588 [Pseudomonas sp. UC 17F4]
MTRSALAALLFAALLGTQAVAAGTGPTNPNPDTTPTTPLPGINTGTNPTDTPLPSGTDPRTQGNDAGRQGGSETDGSRREPKKDGSGSENGGDAGGSAGSY